jgi:hypothetical protein
MCAVLRLLGWPASESGTICRVHGDQERGDRRPPPEGLHVAYPRSPRGWEGQRGGHMLVVIGQLKDVGRLTAQAPGSPNVHLVTG